MRKHPAHRLGAHRLERLGLKGHFFESTLSYGRGMEKK
jgi:hypothetical protein